MEDIRIHFLEGFQTSPAHPSDTGTVKVKTKEGFNFGKFKSGGLHEKHATATWDLEKIRLCKESYLREQITSPSDRSVTAK